MYRSGNVLLTSASRKVPFLSALEQALVRVSPGAIVIAGDSNHLAPVKCLARQFWCMPTLEGVNIDFLVDELLERNVRVVFPSRDGELQFWSSNTERLLDAGVDVVVSSPEVLSLCIDKLKFSEFCLNESLPVIPAYLSLDEFTSDSYVVKERYGSGSQGILLNASRSDAMNHALKLSSPIFQPYVDGMEISIDAWVAKDGLVRGVVLRRRDLVVFGESQVTTTFRNQALELQAVTFLERIRVRGPVVLQAFVIENQLFVIECNARFGGASTASLAVGLDSLYWSLCESFGIECSSTFLRSSREVRQVRVPMDKIIYDPDF